MTPLKYAETVPVFPCRENEPRRKRPYTGRGFHDASRDPAIIRAWWRQWPNALIGMPTGRVSGRWVLDIDVKRPEANGFDTIEDLGRVLPAARMVHTASGGLHVYFNAGERELRNSVGLIGPGLDVRGCGGYVILPSPGSGYSWDPVYGVDSPLALAPDWLWPPKPSRPPLPLGSISTGGLSRYGEVAIDAACNAIVRAGPGQQEATLNSECFSIGTLAGAGALPADIALKALLRAGNAMPDHDAAWPWRPEEIDLKVRRAFSAGQSSPREVRHVRVA
jgi:Bifunctional DNA primase/polymerase, N-terminal